MTSDMSHDVRVKEFVHFVHARRHPSGKLIRFLTVPARHMADDTVDRI